MKRTIFLFLVALTLVSCALEPRKPLPYNDCHVYIRNETNLWGYCQIYKTGSPEDAVYHPIGLKHPSSDKGNTLTFAIDMDTEYTVKFYLISEIVYERVGDAITSREVILTSETVSFTTTHHTNYLKFRLDGSDLRHELSQYDVYEYEPKEA